MWVFGVDIKIKSHFYHNKNREKIEFVSQLGFPKVFQFWAFNFWLSEIDGTLAVQYLRFKPYYYPTSILNKNQDEKNFITKCEFSSPSDSRTVWISARDFTNKIFLWVVHQVKEFPLWFSEFLTSSHYKIVWMVWYLPFKHRISWILKPIFSVIDYELFFFVKKFVK